MQARERNAIIAALRYLQRAKQSSIALPTAIIGLETDGDVAAMTVAELDELCEAVNCRTLPSDFSIEYNGNRRDVIAKPDGTGLSICIEGCTTFAVDHGPVVTIDLEENGEPLVTVYDDAAHEDGQRFNLHRALA